MDNYADEDDDFYNDEEYKKFEGETNFLDDDGYTDAFDEENINKIDLNKEKNTKKDVKVEDKKENLVKKEAKIEVMLINKLEF